jgi:fructose-bisphosphate aldolase class II
MSLYTPRELLERTNGDWAVGAFNVTNMEEVQGVVAAAEDEDAPVILLVSESAIRHSGLEYIASLCRKAAQQTKVPVAVQLDHGLSLSMAVKCLREGFSGVMIDNSTLSFDENVDITRRVVDVARACGVSVEGELGIIGGKEDDLLVAAGEARLTDPRLAAEYIRLSQVDVFAPAIGTAHGLYKNAPALDFARLEQIRRRVSVPLALHGGSDLPDGDVSRLIRMGINKVNVGTDIKVAVIEAVQRLLDGNSCMHESRLLYKAIRDAVYETVVKKLRLFGASGRAGLKRMASRTVR